MKPVRRKIRRHFGLTAKQVAVRSKRPWYFQVLLAVLFIALGFGSAYWIFLGGENKTIRQKYEQILLENKALQTKLVGAQRELQIELATNNNLAKELTTVQDESIKIKEDLFFYKNMLNDKKSK
jgi:uncharacterized protein HemX